MKAVVKNEYVGRPLLSYLRGELSLSGRLLSRLKRTENGITVNGRCVTVRYILNRGDIIELADGDLQKSEAVTPVKLPVQVLFENGDAVLVNKPPHMPTHPSHGHSDDTLANALAYLYRDIPFVFRPINRLDRDTSGVVLVAKNQRAAAFFAEAMKNGEFKKTYLAVTDRALCESGRIEKPIRRREESIITRTVCEAEENGAQYALTEYTPISSKNGHTLVLVTPKTGRTHQIRVHLASIGASICGDDLYGKASELIDRQALHAFSLEFPLPTDERIKISAPLPQDILKLCRALGIKIPNEEDTNDI